MGQGIYRINRRVHWSSLPYNEYCFSIPITLALDFSDDPLIGQKNQDINLVLKTGSLYDKCPRYPQENSFTVSGHPYQVSADGNAFMILGGGARFHTSIYYFPFGNDNRSYVIEIRLFGEMSPLLP